MPCEKNMNLYYLFERIIIIYTADQSMFLPFNLYLFIYLFIYFSPVKQLIMIDSIQYKFFFTCVHTVTIYYLYINTNTCMYIFKKNMVCYI